MVKERIKRLLAEGMTPSQVYVQVCSSVNRQQFQYILRSLGQARE